MNTGPKYKLFYCVCVCFRCVSSCAEPGGLSGRRPSDTADTRKVFDQCVYGSDASVHPNGQISSCSPPTNSDKVFHLFQNKKNNREENE